MSEKERAFQDFYPDNVSHCYGCGRLNPEGLQIKTHWHTGCLAVIRPFLVSEATEEH